jgi:hypothetical protein
MIGRRLLNAGLLMGIIGISLTLIGCGAAHVRREVQASDLDSYDAVYISDVRVYSLEKSAKNNKVLIAKIEEWKAFARKELESYVKDSRYELMKNPPTGKERVLLADLDIKVTYGNRALRYWVGFGAGAGRIKSILTATDSRTGEQKFIAKGDSNLSVAAFGGDMDAVLRSNIKKLIEQYPKRPGEFSK